MRSCHIAPQARTKTACRHACPPPESCPCMMRSYYRYRYHACYRNDRTKLFHASPSHPMLRLCVHRHSPQARCCPATAQAKNDRRTTSKPPSVANERRHIMPVGSDRSGRRRIPVSQQTHDCMGGRDVARCAVIITGTRRACGIGGHHIFGSMCCI